MPLLPHSWAGRVIWAIWFGACVTVLVFAFELRDIRDAPVAFTALMIALTFPTGIIVIGLFVVLIKVTESLGTPLSDSFGGLAVFWTLLVAVGHLQWFVAVPAIARWASKKWHLTTRWSGP